MKQKRKKGSKKNVMGAEKERSVYKQNSGIKK